MTARTDAASSSARTASPLDETWRARVERSQSGALPRGAVTISCPAPFGVGGLGRHLEEMARAVARAGGQPACVCEGAAGERFGCTAVRPAAPSPARNALL